MYVIFCFFKYIFCSFLEHIEGYCLEKDNTNSELYKSLILLLSHPSRGLLFIL